MDREERDEPSGSGADPATGDNAPTQSDPPEQPAATPPERRPPTFNRAFGRIDRRLGNRPLGLYGVLAAGAAVLVVLLAIIWITAGGDDDNDSPPCTNISALESVEKIRDGEVERVNIVYPERSGVSGDRYVSPALLSLNLTDDSCRNLQPQGPTGEVDMYTVLGAIDWYNETTDQRRIDRDISESDSIPAEVLATATPTPSPTVPVTETPTEVATPHADTPTETPIPTIVPTATAPVIGSPNASPGAATPGA